MGPYNDVINGWWGETLACERNSGGNLVNNWSAGPFRVSLLSYNLPVAGYGNEASYANSWGPRDTFAYWADGTSNQLIFGEKFIPAEIVSLRTHTVAEASWDGSNICARANDGVPGFARFIHPNLPCLKRSPYDMPPDANPSVGLGLGIPNHDWKSVVFGGIHVGICQFAIGDGGVRAISTSTNYEVLYWLSNVNDGNAVTIP